MKGFILIKESEMYESDLYKSTKQVSEGLTMVLIPLAATGLIAGIFMGEWLRYLLVVVGIVAGTVPSSLLQNVGSDTYNLLMKACGWQSFEEKLSRQLLSVFSRKLLLSLSSYLYVFICMMFILTMESNVQIMGLTWALMLMIVIDYSTTMNHFMSVHESSALRSIVIEYVFLLLMLFVISIATYFWTIELSLILSLFAGVFVLTNLMVVHQQISILREKI